MLRSVFSKTIWERRWGIFGWVLGGLALTGFLVALYPVVRDSAGLTELVEQLPEGMLSLMGIDPAFLTTGFGYLQAQMYTLMAPLLILVLAIGFGASATAGEEEYGTADLLLATPTPRRRIVLDKTTAMLVITTIVVLSFVVVLLVGNVTVDLKLSIWGIFGINLGLILLGMFFGTLATAIGAWTGRRNLAVAAAGAIAAVAFFIDGMAPLVSWLRGAQRFMPFYWYQVDSPLRNGPTAWLLLLVAGSVVFTAAAVALFRRKDIGVAFSLSMRPRREKKAAVSGASSTSPLLHSVFGKTVWDRRRSFWWWLLGIGSLAALTIAVFPSIAGAGTEALEALLDVYPPEMLAIFGITDPSSVFTGAGFISTRVYSSIGVVIILAFAIGMGRAALAGEEASGTADLLLTTPVRRDSVVLQKAGAMLVLLMALVVGLAIIVALGDQAVGLDLTLSGLVAANVGLAALAFLFGALALAAGAATGSPSQATAIAAGVAVVTFFLNGFGAVVDWLEPLRPLSPFFWYQGDTNPLSQTVGWQQPLLLVVGLVFVGVAMPLFRRRDVGV
ncbi:MAG: ABC transporter permease subunit [Actinomycetota bacterium]|nr:ABC transporter permease subunit [Actinomycetota bacterium]